MVKRTSIKGLQVMMTAASLIGFLGGWVLLGHAPKPGTITQPAPVTITTATNDTTLGQSQLQANGSMIQLPSQSYVSQSAGLRLRTGGS